MIIDHNYPDYAKLLANGIKNKVSDKGILICTSGIGMSIAANRFPFIRGALVFTPEMAEMARGHNDANVLAFGARVVGKGVALGMVDAFFEEEFLGGRHAERIGDLTKLEEEHFKA